MDFKAIFMSMNFLVFVLSLALMIMSAVIRGSATTNEAAVKKADTKAAETSLTNIKNTSNILLVLSLVVLGVSGFNVYKQYSAQSVPSTAFYF